MCTWSAGNGCHQAVWSPVLPGAQRFSKISAEEPLSVTRSLVTLTDARPFPILFCPSCAIGWVGKSGVSLAFLPFHKLPHVSSDLMSMPISAVFLGRKIMISCVGRFS